MSKTVSTICCLSIIPVIAIDHYSEKLNNADIRYNCEFIADALPGTVRLSESVEKGIYTRKITYNVESSADRLLKLHLLTPRSFITIFRDPRGARRICGSPEYPLSLDFTESDGLVTVTLQGKSPHVCRYID